MKYAVSLATLVAGCATAPGPSPAPPPAPEPAAKPAAPSENVAIAGLMQSARADAAAGRLANAAATLERALRIEPRNPRLWRELALVRLKQGDYVQAESVAARSKSWAGNGIMLPNHSPLVIAGQFGTLEALYPGRIDLGLGRAPGTDQLTVRALRRDYSSAEEFPRDVLELQALLGPIQEGQKIVAVPGADSRVPLWILGSSLYGAQLAAMLGLPYAFASHFAPNDLLPALAAYRGGVQPSAQQATPYPMGGLHVVAADPDAGDKRPLTTLH